MYRLTTQGVLEIETPPTVARPDASRLRAAGVERRPGSRERSAAPGGPAHDARGGPRACRRSTAGGREPGAALVRSASGAPRVHTSEPGRCGDRRSGVARAVERHASTGRPHPGSRGVHRGSAARPSRRAVVDAIPRAPTPAFAGPGDRAAAPPAAVRPTDRDRSRRRRRLRRHRSGRPGRAVGRRLAPEALRLPARLDLPRLHGERTARAVRATADSCPAPSAAGPARSRCGLQAGGARRTAAATPASRA